MSDSTVEGTVGVRVDDVRQRVSLWLARVVSVVFGGRVGLVLYLGCLVVFGVVLQLGIFINDNYTLANAVVNLADGRLSIETIVYGPTDQLTPGMVEVGGETYGRAYGVVTAGTLVYWVLAGTAQVADVGILLTGIWSLLLYLTVWLGGDLFGRSREALVLGGLVAGGAFLANTAVAIDIASRWLPLLGLQIATMVTAGFVCVFLYRVFTRMYEQRVGIAAGLTATLGTPVVFWSTIPKRHAFTAALALASVYAFYRSREAETARARLRFRALAYVPAGLTAWIQIADAALLVVPLAIVDLATAEENGLRELTIVALVGLLSCLPVFLTNIAISGSPIQSPMLIQRSIGETSTQPAASTGSTSSTAESGSSADQSGGPIITFQSLFGPLTVFASYLADGIVRMLDPTRVVDVFLRGGYIQEVSGRDGGTIRLAMLEASPVLLGLVAVPVQVVRWLRTDRQISAAVAVDLFVGIYVLLFAVFYMRFLPWHAAVTVRHLLALYPALVYGVFRLRAVRSALAEWHLVAGVGIGTVVVGLELFVLSVLLLKLKTGEAAQLLAVGALVVAGLFGAWALARSVRRDRVFASDKQQIRIGAVVLGVTVGWGAMSMLAFRLFVLPYGDVVVLPAVQWILDFVPFS